MSSITITKIPTCSYCNKTHSLTSDTFCRQQLATRPSSVADDSDSESIASQLRSLSNWSEVETSSNDGEDGVVYINAKGEPNQFEIMQFITMTDHLDTQRINNLREAKRFHEQMNERGWRLIANASRSHSTSMGYRWLNSKW
jgi:hypothetical protein